MTIVKRYKIYTVYDFENDIITIAKTEAEALKVAKYYNGYVAKEYLIKREQKTIKE